MLDRGAAGAQEDADAAVWYPIARPAQSIQARVQGRRQGQMRDQQLRFLLVLDFEAQCEEGVRLRPQEIIEFPTVAIDLQTMRATEFHVYCRPEAYPQITPFCTRLTGITQDMVANGPTLQEALRQHQQWLRDVLGLSPCGDDGRDYAYVTCGDWDLRTCLPQQLASLGIRAPAGYSRWINIKHAFSEWYGCHARGMAGMLADLGIALEGRHHSGIDDTRNIAKVAVEMLHNGWVARA